MPWWMTVTDPEKHRPFPVGYFTDKNLADQAKVALQAEHPAWSIGEPFEAPMDYPSTLPRPMALVTRADGSVVEIWSDGAEYPVE